jgi:hypothetical protein
MSKENCKENVLFCVGALWKENPKSAPHSFSLSALWCVFVYVSYVPVRVWERELLVANDKHCSTFVWRALYDAEWFLFTADKPSRKRCLVQKSARKIQLHKASCVKNQGKSTSQQNFDRAETKETISSANIDRGCRMINTLSRIYCIV